MTERSARVEQCIQEAECIRESIDELAQVQVQVASRSVGLFGSSSDSDSSKSGTENDDQDENDVVEIPSAELGQILMSSGFNWFSVVETVTERYGDVTEPQLEKYYTMVITSDRSEEVATMSCTCTLERSSCKNWSGSSFSESITIIPFRASACRSANCCEEISARKA